MKRLVGVFLVFVTAIVCVDIAVDGPSVVTPLLAMLSLIIVLAAVPRKALAYDDQKVHPWITRQAIELMARHKFAAYAELVYVGGHVSELPHLGGDNPVIHGSIVEDTPATNGEFHFMNPGRQAHDKVGRWSGLSSGVTFGKAWEYLGYTNNHPSALDRALDPNVGSDGDSIHHTYSDAVALYERGEMLLAYEVLGRLCHLVEDMSVPAHVRNDNHLGQYVAGFAIENKGATFRSLVLPEGWFWDGLFPPATAEAIKKGMEPFELVTYDLVLENRAPTTNEEPVMKETFEEFYRQLALHTHDNWYSENTIPGNDTYPGADVSEAVPDLSRCTVIQDELRAAPNTSIMDGLMKVVKAVNSPLSFTYYEAITPRRFENILNSGDARNQGSVKRPYTLTLENHLDCARDVMPLAIRYAAGLVEYFYEEREHLRTQLKSVWVPGAGQQVTLPVENFEYPPPGESNPSVAPGEPVYACLEVVNLGAFRDDLEIRLEGLDGIARAQRGQIGWTVELLLAEPHYGAEVVPTDRSDVWKVTYPKEADLKWQDLFNDRQFGHPPLKLALKITPPGQAQ